MIATSCGEPRRIESRRCGSTTCAANGSRGHEERRSGSVVRAGRGRPARTGASERPSGPSGWRRAWTGGVDEVAGESTDLVPETSGPAVRCRVAVTATGVGHRVGRLPCVTNLGLLLPRGGRPPGSGILPADELLVDPLVQCIGRPGARNLLGDDDDVGLPRRRLPRRRRQGRHLRVYYGHD